MYFILRILRLKTKLLGDCLKSCCGHRVWYAAVLWQQMTRWLVSNVTRCLNKDEMGVSCVHWCYTVLAFVRMALYLKQSFAFTVMRLSITLWLVGWHLPFRPWYALFSPIWQIPSLEIATNESHTHHLSFPLSPFVASLSREVVKVPVAASCVWGSGEEAMRAPPSSHHYYHSHHCLGSV